MQQGRVREGSCFRIGGGIVEFMAEMLIERWAGQRQDRGGGLAKLAHCSSNASKFFATSKKLQVAKQSGRERELQLNNKLASSAIRASSMCTHTHVQRSEAKLQ